MICAQCEEEEEGEHVETHGAHAHSYDVGDGVSYLFLVSLSWLIPDVSSAMVLVRVALGDCLYPYSGVAMVLFSHISSHLISCYPILSRCAWR